MTMSYVTNQEAAIGVQRRKLQALAQRLREDRTLEFRASAGRPATRSEIVRTAWANLAIEEPDLTLAEALRILGEDEPEAP
ncbi:MAG TPA: hypothetical protein VKU87_00535 [Thermomicrobiaceae bacterium]|nr:hypothetical protein [Thermomicrobiaceae bacterium]